MKVVSTASTGVKQTLGRFVGQCGPGLHFYVPFLQTITTVSNKKQQLEFVFPIRTKDEVTTDVHASVQFYVKEEDSHKALFTLQKPWEQIEAQVGNVVRAQSSNMTLAELYSSRADIADSVSTELSEKMASYGYTLEGTLVGNIVPPKSVVEARNRINASMSLKEATQNEADANYINVVRQAEADRDRKILQGEGVSGQRKAILSGYQASVDNMSESLGLTPSEVVAFVLQMQHLDTMEAIGKSENAKIVFMSQKPQPLTEAILQTKD